MNCSWHPFFKWDRFSDKDSAHTRCTIFLIGLLGSESPGFCEPIYIFWVYQLFAVMSALLHFLQVVTRTWCTTVFKLPSWEPQKKKALHRDLTKLCTIWSRVSIKICRLYCSHFSMLYGLPGTFHLLGKKLLSSWFWNVDDLFSVTCYRWIVLTSCLVSCYTMTVNGNVLLPSKRVMYEACTATRLLFRASLKTLGAI